MPALEAVLDALEHDVGEGGDLRPDERSRKGGDEQDGHDLRDEGQRDFLDLGQRLNERDADADEHRRRDRRSRGDKHGPDGLLDDIERVGLVHEIALAVS